MPMCCLPLRDGMAIMTTARMRKLVGPLTCVALTAGVIIGVPYLAADSASAASTSPSSAAPASRAASLTKVKAASIAMSGAVKKNRSRSVKVIGTAGIPSAGVVSVRARITLRSARAGKVTISPPGKYGSRTVISLKAGKSTSKTLTKAIGTKGRWTIRNATKGNLKVNVSARGFVSSSIANSATPCGRTTQVPAWEHVVWVVLENHGPASVAAGAPYLTSLARTCSSATNMWARTHPSLPNYIALTSGSRQGISDSGLPAAHPLNVTNIFSQLGTDWRTLAQTMPSNCYKNNSAAYVARHNPATYYTNLAGACESRDVPMGSTPDLSAKFTLVVPDNNHNGHDTGIAAADNWAKGYLPKILDSAQYRAGKTAVFVFFDEAEGSGDVENQVNMFVLSPSTPKGAAIGTRFTHYSTLRATEEMLGLGLIGGAATAPDMRPEFKLG